MSKIFYTGQYMLRRTGRKSPNAFAQMKHQMPKPEGVVVSGVGPSLGWSLKTWEKIARERQPRLQNDLLAAIEELRAEEAELIKTHLK